MTLGWIIEIAGTVATAVIVVFVTWLSTKAIKGYLLEHDLQVIRRVTKNGGDLDEQKEVHGGSNQGKRRA